MIEGKTRRRYDRAFKEEAVRLVLDKGQTLAGTARDLGITENMLQRWKQEYLEDQENAFPGKGRMKPAEAELHHNRQRRHSTLDYRTPLECYNAAIHP
jgi:transposase